MISELMALTVGCYGSRRPLVPRRFTAHLPKIPVKRGHCVSTSCEDECLTFGLG